MSHRNHAAVAAFLVSTAAAPLPAAEVGVIYTASRSTDTGGALPTDIAVAEVRGWAQGELGRVEFLEGSSPATPAGSLLLTSDGGDTVLYMDAGRGSCRLADPSGASRPRFPPGGLVSRIEGLEIEELPEGEGAEVAGLATRHRRFRLGYDTIRTPVTGASGPSSRAHTEVVEDLWVGLETLDRGFELWLAPSPHSTGDPAADSRIAAVLAKLQGSILKRVTAVTIHEGGSARRSVSTTEITSMERTEVPASRFEAPEACRAIRTGDPR